MHTFRDTLENRIEQLDKLIARKMKAVEEAPDGCLRIGHSNNSVQFFDRNKYLSKRDPEMIRKLAQKNYDMKIIRTAQSEKALLVRLLSDYPNVPVETLYSEQSEMRQEFIRPIILPDEVYAERWQNEPYIKKPFNEDLPEIESNRGERVRSKSEKMIADMLALNGVPYKYECPLVDEYGNTIHPDFTILKVRTREIFYWEHCGRLDDPKYARDLDDRMRFYGKLGIFAGDKLLITTEISDNPINMRLAESMMRTVLL